MQQVFAEEVLIGNFGNGIGTIGTECNYIIDVRTIEHENIFFEGSSHKAFFVIGVKLHVSGCDDISLNGIEYFYLGFTLFAHPIFLDELLKIGNRIIGKMRQMLVYFCYFGFNASN